MNNFEATCKFVSYCSVEPYYRQNKETSATEMAYTTK